MTPSRKTPMKQSGFKRKARKKRAGHDLPMLVACKDQECYLRVPGVCMGAWGYGTIVPCHANWSDYGKGMGLKAKDTFTVPGCMSCHSWLDQGPAPKAEKKAVWEAAFSRWKEDREKLLTGKL